MEYHMELFSLCFVNYSIYIDRHLNNTNYLAFIIFLTQ